jgi:hypothetical protein
MNDDFELDGSEDRHFFRILERRARDGCQGAMDSVYFMVKGKLNWSGTPDLKDLLTHSRYCKSSDARDRVFAFAGLGDPGHGIVPDYSPENTIAQVFIGTAHKIMLFEDSLEILSLAAASQNHLREGLPS